MNITSGALWGGRFLALYSAAKAGITGLTYTLAIEGEPHGIKVNTLGPAAGTVAITHLNEESDRIPMMFENFQAEQVAPAVAYLAHEECEVSAKYFESAGGRVWQRYLTETTGYTNPELTIEDVRDHLDEIMNGDGASALADPIEVANSPLMSFKPKPYVRSRPLRRDSPQPNRKDPHMGELKYMGIGQIAINVDDLDAAVAEAKRSSGLTSRSWR